MNHEIVVCKKLCRVNHEVLDLENLELYGSYNFVFRPCQLNFLLQ